MKVRLADKSPAVAFAEKLAKQHGKEGVAIGQFGDGTVRVGPRSWPQAEIEQLVAQDEKSATRLILGALGVRL